ncbi:MAG: radical SAM protein [Elusimicrobiota bacterium]|jgi:MoaA/NifB/PqqE/SkfB family radical SAM enzyme
MSYLRRAKNILFTDLPILAKTEILRRFPGLWGILRLRPTSVWINPTDNCNMRCIMCTQWRETKTGELTTAQWKDVLTQCRKLGIRSVGFNGGEPLLRKDLPEITAFASGLGMECSLITSGFLLDAVRLESLLSAGLRRLTLSLDGVGEDYERIRGREWGRAEQAARLAAQAHREGRLEANIGFVAMRQTLANFDKLQAFAAELDLPVMVSLVDSTPFFFRLPDNLRGQQQGTWVGPEQNAQLRAFQQKLVQMKSRSPRSLANAYTDIEYMGRYFSAPLQAEIPCSVAQLRILVDSQGHVHGGCWSLGAYGSMLESSISEILASPKALNAHRAMFYKRCPGCSCGYTTSVRYSLASQLRECLYRFSPSARSRIIAEPAQVPTPAVPVEAPLP